jgi:hypothetical protein
MSQVCIVLRAVVVAVCACGMQTAAASSIVYDVNIVNGTNSITGTLTTDGQLGALMATDFTDWDIVVASGSVSETFLGPLSGGDLGANS